MILSKKYIIPVLLFLFYTVGIFGVYLPEFKIQVIALTPMNLLLTLVLLIWGLGVFNPKLVYAMLAAFILGYLVEVAGVASGLLFGEYEYGKPLGWKLFDVPLIIGVNWLILSFSSLGIVGRFISNSFTKVVFASLLMVLLDVLIEPVAIKLDFWTWTQADVPLQNYIMWFFSAILINSIVSVFLREINYKTSVFVFLAQVYFFSFLYVLL